MLLGKRQRPPIKRTTSMTEFTLDLNNVVVAPTPTLAPMPSYDYSNNNPIKVNNDGSTRRNTGGVVAGSDGFDHRILSSVSPRNFHRRNSADFVETPHFLRSCGLCKRRLAPGRDLYMYRGDTAFCSLECRQQQMNQDERKEKCSLSSKKEASSTVGSEASSNGETVAAA